MYVTTVLQEGYNKLDDIFLKISFEDYRKIVTI